MNLEEKDFNELKREVVESLDNAPAENKGEAIYEALEKYFEVKYADLIGQLKLESAQAESDKEYANKLGLRTLSKNEKDFYEKIKDIKQAVSGKQIDEIPTSITDITLAEIREDGGLLSHVNFTPANVGRWFTASKAGSYAWAKLTAALERGKDITASFESLVYELGKLYILIIIPKSINDLSLPFIDKYFRAVLKEQETAGMEYGFIAGTGVEQPIGIYKKIDEVDSTSKENVDKTLNTNVVNFTPKGLAAAKKYLTNGGTRSLKKLILVCNPEDRADYVDPALFDDEGRNVSSFKNLEVIDTPENPKGKAAFYLDKTYYMGCSGMKVKNYDQTLALEDADVMIGTAYANGRALDDKCAYVFDVTKLEEYVSRVKVVNIADANSVEGA